MTQGLGIGAVRSCSASWSMRPSLREMRSLRVRSSDTSVSRRPRRRSTASRRRSTASKRWSTASKRWSTVSKPGIHVFVHEVKTLVHVRPEFTEALVHLRPQIVEATVHGNDDDKLQDGDEGDEDTGESAYDGSVVLQPGEHVASCGVCESALYHGTRNLSCLGGTIACREGWRVWRRRQTGQSRRRTQEMERPPEAPWARKRN